MKLLIVIFLLIFCSCASSDEKNENVVPTVTPSSTVTSDTAHGDTMMQPNGVSNGTVILDTSK